MNVTEQDIKLQQMTGYYHQGRNGVWYINTPKATEEKSTKRYRDFISRSFKEIDETYNISKAVPLPLQEQWTRSLSYIQQDSHGNRFSSPVNLISCYISSTFDTLPPPSNLKRWRISSQASCFLCNKTICTTEHILGACSVALKQGRFTFRHDNALSHIFATLKRFISNIDSVPPKPKHLIKFRFDQEITSYWYFTPCIRLEIVNRSAGPIIFSSPYCHYSAAPCYCHFF